MLDKLIKRGPPNEPLRVLLHGVEGIGKTTFASKIPGVIFLSPEDGGGDLDLTRIPVRTWQEANDRIDMLIREEHDFHTLCIDTIDYLERLCNEDVCKDAKVTTIEDVGGGYGKGGTASVERQNRLAERLNQLREKRRMHIVLLAHTVVKAFNDPEGPAYDRFEVAMSPKAGLLWCGWADCVLFANYEIKVRVAGNGEKLLKKGKAVDNDLERMLYTVRRPAFTAKNRYSLPEVMDFTWDEFSAAIRWDERSIAIRANVPAPEPPTADQVRAAVVHALRELDWINEEVIALLGKYGAAKAADVPESKRAEVISALQISHTKAA